MCDEKRSLANSSGNFGSAIVENLKEIRGRYAINMHLVTLTSKSGEFKQTAVKYHRNFVRLRAKFGSGNKATIDKIVDMYMPK